ncbi:MAG: hypothetical protein K2X29_06800 [Candidatus Obscuribacterales bacterium]|nr:hypothetical protein [Candidatus Obscuribacterales bacterium]
MRVGLSSIAVGIALIALAALGSNSVLACDAHHEDKIAQKQDTCDQNTIIANQKTIIENQGKILAKLDKILENQNKLDTIVSNQERTSK